MAMQPVQRFNGYIPGLHLIESFGAGGFRFAGISHRGSIIALPAGIHIWPVVNMTKLTLDSLAPAFAETGLTHIIIGTGQDIAYLPKPLQEAIRAAGMVPETMATAAAVRTYNILAGEGRMVAAALIAVADL